MIINRRSFLSQSILSCISILLITNWSKKSYGANKQYKEILIWSNTGNPSNYIIDSKKFNSNGVIGFNLNNDKKIFIPLTFYGHHLAHFEKTGLAVTNEKWGSSLALIDLKNMKLISEIQSPKGIRFFGHLQFSEDGNEFYASAMNDVLNKGMILVYQTKELKLLRSFETHGISPHQLRLISKDELMVANAGSKTISILNPNNGDLIKLISVNESNPAHFIFEKSLDTIIIGGRNFGKASPNLTPQQQLEFEAQFKNILSKLEIHDAYKGIAGKTLTLAHSEILSIEKTFFKDKWLSLISLPHAKKIILVDMLNRELLFTLDLDFSPTGIVFSNIEPNRFYVNSKESDLFIGEIENLKINFNLKINKLVSFGNGQHLSMTSS
jgi:hypothetical protein